MRLRRLIRAPSAELTLYVICQGTPASPVNVTLPLKVAGPQAEGLAVTEARENVNLSLIVVVE